MCFVPLFVLCRAERILKGHVVFLKPEKIGLRTLDDRGRRLSSTDVVRDDP